MTIEEIDQQILENAKEQRRLGDEMSELLQLRINSLRKQGQYQCEVCTAHGTLEELTYCAECGNTYCNNHCTDNLCRSCGEDKHDWVI